MADLLTTRQVQDILQVDRTTIYRMVESGQLPGIRVGKQWRFDRDEIDRWLHAGAVSSSRESSEPVSRSSGPDGVKATGPLAELLPIPCIQMMQDVFADALGVMIVVTDMDGRPVTAVSNTCGLFDALMADQAAVAQCIAHWQHLAGGAMLEPRFAPSNMGLLCARGLIRSGNELKGMVFVGGIAPDVWPPASEELAAIADHFGLEPDYFEANVAAVFRKSKVERDRVLPFVQRIADIFSHILEDRNNLHGRLQAIASLTTL